MLLTLRLMTRLRDPGAAPAVTVYPTMISVVFAPTLAVLIAPTVTPAPSVTLVICAGKMLPPVVLTSRINVPVWEGSV